jgi:tRNA pseudouridine55 synthase
LANDFGARLNNGAYLYALRRTKIGNYDVTNAFTIEQFMEKIV